MKNKILLPFVFLFFGIFTSNVFSASLSELLEIGKEQDEIQSALKDETKCYNKISSAVSDGQLTIGLSKDEIFNEYGQPSVIVPQNDGQTKAVYKPSNRSYFDNEKVTLFFDAHDKLLNISIGQN
jgi:hypothetical protein